MASVQLCPTGESARSQLAHRRAIASGDRFLVTMPEVPHLPATAHHHVTRQRRVAGEQEAVDQRTRIARVRAQFADRHAAGLGTASQRGTPERFADAVTLPPRSDVAVATEQT